jgi:RND family efflux transporter MFP subunit
LVERYYINDYFDFFMLKKNYFIIILLTFLASYQQSYSSPNTTRPPRTSAPHLIKTLTVSPQPLTTTARYTGSLRARRVMRIFTQEEGRITDLPYYEGDSVKANALLVQLDEILLKAELNKATANHKYARVNVQRHQKLARRKLVSADELARAETELEIVQAEEQILRTRLSYTKMTMPFTGIVTARLAEVGDVVAKNTHILTVIDPNSLIIDVDVSERLLSKLQLEYSVSVQIDALGTKTFKGTISRIHPTIDARTRLGRLEVTLLSLPLRVQEGQFCRVTIETQLSPRLTLPYTALRRDRDGEYVFIVDADNKAQRQMVTSGQRLADKVEILTGLKKGQIVVIKGFLGLHPGKMVQAVD